MLEERVDTLEAALGQFIVHTDVALRRLERSVQEMNRQWGELANKMGTLVEDIVAPNIEGIAQRYFSCSEIEDFMVRRYKRNTRDRSVRREFDVVAICWNKVIINETKSNPNIDYIDAFIEVLKEIYDYFPEYQDKKIIPIFSSLYLPEEAVLYLTKNRIYAMAMKKNTKEILNFDLLKNPVNPVNPI